MMQSNLLRRVVERLSRRVVFRRRLPARFGSARLSVSPGAALCYYRQLDGRVWRELFDFAEFAVGRGAVVWDVGASMGVFSFAAAHVAGPGGQVLAVEADTWAAELLKSSAGVVRPNAAPVRVLCAAVADETGHQGFAIPERGRAGSHLTTVTGAGNPLLGGIREVHPVITVTLDWLAEKFGAPSVVKIDVEGAELSALQGGEGVLADARPAIMLEVYERSADAITVLLHRHGYQLFDIAPGWNERRAISRATYNTVALPG